MEPWREELALLEARLAVQHLALRALVHSHPDPPAVLDEWRKLRADNVAAAYALPADVRVGEWLSEQVQALAADWMAELALAASRHAVEREQKSDGDGVDRSPP
jgi:hypothetical protein